MGKQSKAKQRQIGDGKKAAGTIANKLAAIDYLKDVGFNISKSTFYRHFAGGKIGPQKDGSFLKADVDAYAKAFLKLTDGTAADPAPVEDDTQVNKRFHEARKIKAQADHWQIKAAILRGEYIERAAFERALARRAAIFKSDGENFFRVNAGEIINITKGDLALAPDLIDFCLQQFEAWLNRYSEDKEFELPAQADIKHLTATDNRG